MSGKPYVIGIPDLEKRKRVTFNHSSISVTVKPHSKHTPVLRYAFNSSIYSPVSMTGEPHLRQNVKSFAEGFRVVNFFSVTENIHT